MKKLLFFLLIFVSNFLYSQDSINIGNSQNFNKFNISLTGGYSDVSGFLGTEISRKSLGLEFGWAKKEYVLNNYTESRNVICFGITYYLLFLNREGLDTKYPVCHFQKMEVAILLKEMLCGVIKYHLY